MGVVGDEHADLLNVSGAVHQLSPGEVCGLARFYLRDSVCPPGFAGRHRSSVLGLDGEPTPLVP